MIDEYDQDKQIFGKECLGKTITNTEVLNNTQMVISFTDGTHLTLTARLSGGKPWIGRQVPTGTVEQEWKKEK